MVQRESGSYENTKRPAAVSDNSKEMPHIEIPMRISAATILICAVNFQVSDEALSDAIPIALALLDDVQSIHQAIGALISISVIEAASSSKLGVVPTFIERFWSILTKSFEDAIQMLFRAEPPILTIICLTQSKWIDFLGSLCTHTQNGASVSSSAVRQMALKSAATLIVAIGNQVHAGGRNGNDERIAGAFVAGITPLLAQLAEFPEAASIEINRAGLATILTEVFLLLDRAEKDATYLHKNKIEGEKLSADEVSTDATRKMALHSAAVTGAICGDSA